jgi:hypothetical protein
MAKKNKDFRDEVKKMLPHVLQAAFEQGQAAQRMENAQMDFGFATQKASQQIANLMALIDTPEKKDLN